MTMPPAPMPPPLDINVGPFEDVPMAHIDDYDDRGRDVFDGYDGFDRKGKKDKKNKELILPKYEGYTLEKAQPLPGEKPSWARIGKRPLPFNDKQLLDIAKRHRLRTRTGPEQDLKQLSSNQAGVVDRLIAEQKRLEKNKNADWVLYDVQRFGKWSWTTMEVKKIQVILKRVDKNQLSAKDITRGNKTSFQDFEIIDLAEPEKKKGKKAKRSRSLDNLDPLDDPLGLGQGIPLTPNHGHQQMPRESRDHFDAIPVPPIGPPPMHPPPGAIPVDPHGPNQFPPQFGQPFQTSARRSFHNDHPFLPHPDVASPIQFEDGNPWPHPHPVPIERIRARSQSRPRERRPSTRRPSVDARKFRQLEDKVDDLNYKMSNWRVGSDSSEYDDDSIFSSPPSDGQSFSPPSSPRSYFSDVKARGSLEGRRASTSRDPRYHGRYRSHRYQDTEIQPAYSYRDDRRDYPEGRRHSKRPSLHHARTYDDYPSGRGAEQRYLPAPPGLMRRQTEFGDGYDNGEYDRRRQSMNYDQVYEPRRRDSMLESRRQSYYGGAGGERRYHY